MKKILTLFLILFYIANIFAQTDQTKLALVIGNANYQNSGELQNPVNDANLMTKTLKELGFTVISVTDATKSEMDDAILDFSRKLANYNVALFYYAGHGVQVNGINYLIPIDAKLDDQISVSFEAINVNNIVNQFEYYPDNLNIVILDACRDNPFRSWQRGGNRGFKAISAPSGTIIAYATREGETASDGTGSNGLFTEQLVIQMNKNQSIEQVFKNTRIEVLNISNKAQCPQEWSMFTGDFYFTKEGNSIQSVDDKQTITIYKEQTTNISIEGDEQLNQFIDKRDGKTYKTVEIGEQIWMAENLAYKANSGCWAYDNNKNLVSKYGYLYNWETAKNVCPDGWHLPYESDFEILMSNFSEKRNKLYNALIINGNSGFSAVFFNGETFFSHEKGVFHINSYNKKVSLENCMTKSGFSIRCIKDN